MIIPHLCEGSPAQDISSQAVQMDPGFPVNQVVAVILNPHTCLIYLWCHPIKISHRAGWFPDFKGKTTLVVLRHFAYFDHVSRIRYEIQLGLKI